MRKAAPQRRLNYRFWRGDTYWFLQGGNLSSQTPGGAGVGGGKPSHRIRNKYPFIAMVVASKVSAATQRIPSYDVVPSSAEPDDYQAAQLAQKISLWGYDAWRLRRVKTQCFTHALVGGEGFAYPYFDTSVGPYIEVDVEDPITGEPTGETESVGQGEVRVKVLSANEVYWEPGVDFDNARWYCIEQARTKEEVEAMPGFFGGEVTCDATDSDAPKDSDPANLVTVTEWLERPSAKHKRGRRIVIANKRRIVPDGDYPCQDRDDNVLDEPVLVRISWTVEVDDRDRSLVEQLIDLQRTIQDCWNKLLEWKNRALNPQMIVPRGANMSRKDDTPGAQWHYNPGLKPEWEKPPAIPRELFEMQDRAIEQMRAIASDVDVQPDPRLTTGTAQAAIEQAQLRWQSFLGDGAEFDSRLMRLCLYLVQRYYTEARDLKVMGSGGPDLIPAFRGADLLGQADVRVTPALTRTRQEVERLAMLYAQNQWITPQMAMEAIQSGAMDRLSQAWMNDVGRAWFLIQTIKRGPDALMALPDRPLFPGEPQAVDANGQPLLPGPDGEERVPGWMPRPFDKVEIQKNEFETWMKTTDWDRLPRESQHMALLVYQAYIGLEQRQQIEEAQRQQQMAESLGIANAAKPQGPPQLPSQSAPENQG